MRDCALGFTFAELQRLSLLHFPCPLVFLSEVFRNGIGELPHDLLVEIGPEFGQRHITVKKNIEGGMKWIVETFHEGERLPGFWRGIHRPTPEGAAVSEDVHFVEQLPPIPERLV